MKLRCIRAVARKEFLHIFRDLRSLYITFMIPLILLMLFGYALKMDVEQIQTGVLDLEKSAESRDFVARLTASRYFRLAAPVQSYAQLQQRIDDRTFHAGLVIPPDFSHRIKGHRQAALQVLVDGSNSNRASIVIGYLEAIKARYNMELVMDSVKGLGLPRVAIPLDHRMRIWFNEDLESKKYIIPGLIAVIMMVIGAMMTALTIVREWDRGTMETLLSVPIRPEEIILGKMIPYYFIGMMDLLLVLVLARFAFGIRMQGSLALLVFSAAIFLYVAIGLGIFISSVAKSQLAANQISTAGTFLPAFLLSGFIFPVDNMPLALQAVGRLVPATYFVAIVHGIYLRGADLRQLWPNLLALVLFGLALTVMTVLFGRRRLG